MSSCWGRVLAFHKRPVTTQKPPVRLRAPRLRASTAQEGHLEGKASAKGELCRRGQLHTAPTLPKEAHPRPKSLKTPTRKPPPRRQPHQEAERAAPKRQHNKNGPRRPQGPAALFETPHF